MSDKTIDQLAADVERNARLRAAELQESLGIHVSASTSNGWKGAYAIVDFDGLAELVSRLQTAEAEVERQKGRIYALETNLPENYLAALEAAEAQVDALTRTIELSDEDDDIAVRVSSSHCRDESCTTCAARREALAAVEELRDAAVRVEDYLRREGRGVEAIAARHVLAAAVARLDKEQP